METLSTHVIRKNLSFKSILRMKLKYSTHQLSINYDEIGVNRTF